MPDDNPQPTPPAKPADSAAPSAEIPLPLFVSAEAAVKSTRKDYVSLFDPAVDINDFKKCRSDPALMKQAVKSLKEAGFVVTSVGQCSVGIKGAPALFEKTFSIKLVAVAPPEDAPPQLTSWALSAGPENQKGGVDLGPLIPVAQTSPFAPFLDSVYLDPPASPTSGTRRGDVGNQRDQSSPNVIYLDEIAGLLGGGPGMPTGMDVGVTVVDDDVFTDHSWFQPFRQFIINCRHAQVYKRGESHGSYVCSCLLAVAKDVKVSFVRTGGSGRESFARCLDDLVVDIINCSWGEFPLNTLRKEKRDGDEKRFKEIRHSFVAYWAVACSARRDQLIIWTAGNAAIVERQGRPAQAYLADLENVIVVGGALPARGPAPGFNLDPAGPVTAGLCRGGMRFRIYQDKLNKDRFLELLDTDRGGADIDLDTPAATVTGGAPSSVANTVCGVYGRIPMPDASLRGYPEAWGRTEGTSFAAPQVAALCAMVKQIWKGASPANIKSILMETSTPVTNGSTWEGLSLWNDVRGIHIGLAHIGRAVSLARFFAGLVPFIRAVLNLGGNGGDVDLVAFFLNEIELGVPAINQTYQRLMKLPDSRNWNQEADFIYLRNGSLRVHRLSAMTFLNEGALKVTTLSGGF